MRRGARALRMLGALGSAAVLVPLGGGAAGAASPTGHDARQAAAGCAYAVSSPSSGPITECKTVTRVHLDAHGGPVTSNDPDFPSSRNVAVTVSQTDNLINRQQIAVSWTGAQPTGRTGDYNGIDAEGWPYPMVVLECRGVDSGSAPADQRMTPQTCWVHSSAAHWISGGSNVFQPWNLDRYATAASRMPNAGRPATVSPQCGDSPGNERWLPFVAADGTVYPYGDGGCDGSPPEDSQNDDPQQLVPQNSTFAATGDDGTGSVKFDVWTNLSNSSLGCTATVACSLVVIPIMGISCDPYGVSPDSAGLSAAQIPSTDANGQARSQEAAAQASCEATDSVHSATLGTLWWSESNWRNRLTFPLSFAPTSDACSGTSGQAPVSVYGSQLMDEAMSQWLPHFCGDASLFPMSHLQTAEPLAQSLLNDPTSGVKAALASIAPPGGFSQPTVKAPVAITGFAISFNIDDASGHAVESLKLNARLLAKLLTESYTGENLLSADPNAYKYLQNNPVTIASDPEYQALNPNASTNGAKLGLGSAATLLSVAENTDVITGLTSYINADPEARAWLNGKPDPWGMVVNPNYKGIALPVQRWPLLDSSQVEFASFRTESNCEASDPTPWMTLVASPVADLPTSAADVQFATAPSKISCAAQGNGSTDVVFQWIGSGRQPPGKRFVLGVTSLADADAFGLNTAQLESQSSVKDLSAKFTSGSGRSFVAPTTGSLKAAAAMLTFDSTTSTWTVPYAKLRSDPAGQAAYPGIMPVYAAIPSHGLSPELASDYAKFLTFVTGPGQKSGVGVGELPPGYLPLTRSNGLDTLAGYAARAAAAVQAQLGTTADPLNTKPPSSTIPTPTSSAPASPTPTPSPSGRTSSAPEPTRPAITPVTPGPPVVPSSGSSSSTPAPSPSPPSGATSSTSIGLAAQTLTTPSADVGAMTAFLPLLLGAALLAGLAATGVLLRPSSRRVPEKKH